MSAAFVSAAVAGVAVIVSAVTQYFTLHQSRENTLLTLEEARRTARLSAQAAAAENWESGLREDLAEFATLTADVEYGFRHAMEHNEAWPGDKKDLVSRVDVLYGRITLRLDLQADPEARLNEAIAQLMTTETDELWIRRRDRVLAAARDVFAARHNNIFGQGS